MIRQKRFITLFLAILLLIGTFPVNIFAAVEKPNWDNAALEEIDANYWALPKTTKPVSISTQDPVKVTSLVYDGNYVNAKGQTVIRFAWQHRQTVKSSYWQKVIFKFDPDLFNKINWNDTKIHTKNGDVSFGSNNAANAKQIPFYGTGGLIEGLFGGKDIRIPIDIVLNSGVTVNDLNKDYLIQNRITDMAETSVLSTSFGNGHTYQSYTKATMVPFASGSFSKSLPQRYYDQPEKLDIYGTTSFAIYDDVQKKVLIYYGYQKNDTLTGKMDIVGLKQIIPTAFKNILKTDQDGNVGQIYLADYNLSRWNNNISIKFKNSDFNNDGSNERIIFAPNGFNREDSFRTVTIPKLNDYATWGATKDIVRVYTVFEYNIDEEKLEKLYEEEDFLKNFIATTSYVVGSADQWKEYNLTLNENVNIPAGGKLQVNFETSLSKKNADIIVKVGDRYFRYNNYPYAADAEGQIGNLYFDSTTSTSNKYRETLHDGMSIPQGTDIKIYTLSAYDKNTSANITLGDKTFTANAGLNSVKFEDLYDSKENIGIQIPRNEFNPKADEIFTDSTEMTGYAKRVEADVLIRQLLPASKKIDVRRPTDSVATPIDINGTQYDGYKFTSSKSDGTSTFSFVKDAPIKFRTVKQNIFPGKWVIEQVQSKIDFDYNGGIYKSGTTNIDHVEKIVPFNKEYYYNPSTGELNPNYTPNGFVGDNIKLEDNEGNKLTGEALAKRQFIFKETESNYKTNMPKLLNDYDNSMTIIGWTTVKLKNGEKTQEQQFRELKAGGDANHVRNIDDWKKTEPLIFDEKSPISEHKTVYAVWGEKGISLVPNWSENGIEKSGIVNVPISNGKPGDKVTLTSVYGQGDFVRPGYSLVGFSVNKDAKEPDKNETLLNGKVIDRFLRDGDTYTLPENYTDGMELYAVWKPYFTVKASKEWSPEYSLDNNKNNLQLALLGRPAVGAFGEEVVDVDGRAIYYPMPGTEKDYTGSGEVIWENMPSYDGKGKRMSYLVVELVDDTMKQAFKNGSTDMTDYGIIISPMSGTPGTDTFKPPRKIQSVGFEGEGGVDAFTGATVRSHFTDTNYNNAVNPHDTSDFGYFDTYGYKTVLTNTKAEVVMPIIDQVKVKKTEPRNDITINIKDDITDIDESYTVKGKIDFAADSKSDIEYTATYKNGEWTIVFNPYGEAISLDKENSNSEKLVLKTKDPLEVDDKITASSQKGAATSLVTQMIVQLDEPSRLPTDIKQVKNISEGDKYYSVIEAKEFELELNGIPTKVMPSNTEYTLVDEAGEEVLIEGAPITVKADETGKITFKIPHNEANDGKIYKIKVKEPDRDPNTTTDSVTLVTKAPKISALNKKIEGFVGEPIKPLKITTDKDANLIFDPSILHRGLSLDKTIGDYNRQWTINGTPTVSGQSSFVFRSGDEFGNKSSPYSVNINILDRIKVVEDTSSAVPAGMLRVTFKLADDAKGKLEINGNPVENNSITYDVKQGLDLSDAKSLGLDIPEIVADDGYTGTTWTPAIPDIFNESGEYIASIKQNIIETDGIGEIPEGYTRVKFVTGNGVEFTNAKIYDVLNGMTLPAYYYPNYNVVGNFEEPVRWTYTDGVDTLLVEPGTLIVGKAGDKAPKEIEIKADAKSTGNIKITVESENLIDKENNVLTVKEDSIWHDIKSEAENLLNVNSEESILWTLNGEPITDATRFSYDSTIKVTVVKNIVTGTNKSDAPREGYTRLKFNADSENSDAVISYGEIKDIEYFYIDALNGTEVSVLGLKNITATKEGNAFKEWSPTLPTYGNVEQLPDKEFTAIYEALDSVIAFEPSDKVNPTDKTDENIPKIDKDGNEIKLSDYTIVGYVAKENGTLTLGDLTNKEAISLLVKNATPWADVQAPTPVGNEGYRFGSWNPNLETEGNVSEKTFEASFYKADSIIPKNVDNATNPDTSRYSLVKFVTSDENKGSVIAKEDSGSTEFWVDVREGNVIFADLSEKVNVTAKENYIFKDWTKDDLTIVKEATRINEEFVKVNSEITIKANFSDNFESIIPGTGNTKPEGYVTVIFTSGDNASLDGEKTYYIKPDGSVRIGDIIEKAPTINPNEGFKVSEPNWKKEGESKSLDILEKITSDITLVANVAKTDAESYTPVINNLSVGKDATVSPTDFISNLNKSVKVGEDTFDKLPTGTKVEFVGDAPDTTSAGEKEVTLKITYPDGSEDEIKANLEVLDPPKKEAEIYTPVDNNQTVKAGQKPLASDSVKFTKDGEDVAIPDGAVIVWASEPDTSTTGVKDGTVTIIYSDGSRENLAVKITVEEKDPDIIPVENADTLIKDGYVRVVFEKDNKIKELKGTTIYDVRKDSDVRLGDLTKPEITPMDGYKVSESPWKLNGDKLDELKRIKDFTEKETVTITATADENQALANEPTVINQTVISGETPIAEKHVSNINELPAGTSVNYKETPPTEVGTHDVTIVINYPDGSSEEKTTKITIVTADAIVPVLPKDPSNPDSGETENPDETRYVLVELKAGKNGTLEKVGDNKTLKFYVDKTKNVTFGDISSKVNPVPNEGYDFTNWTGEDGTELTENSKITDNLVATANFTNKAASNEPKVNDVRGSDKTIGGTGVAGAKIEVSLPSGEKLTTTVGTDGTWKVEVPEGTNLQAEDKIEVTQTENGKLPNKTTAEVLEKDVSKTPTILPATEGDTKVTITVPEKTDGTVEVVVNKGKDNEKTYTATKDTDGNYIVNLTEELKAGDTIDAVFTEKDKKPTEASTVTVQGKEASDAVKYNPVAQEITKKFGESVTENEIIGAVTVPDYPEDAEQKPVVTIDKGQILPDGNSPGKYNINVTVTYPDKTEDRITVKVTIVEDEVKPLADTIEPNIPTKTPVGDINNLTDTEREEIADKIKEANKDIFPENTTVSVDNKGNATIIYPDNSVDTIVATDLVKLTESPEDKTSRKPDINKLEIGDMIISGRGVAGSQIIVTLPSGDTLETIVNDDGTWAIKLLSPVEDGEKYVAVQIEEGKEPSIPDEESVIKDNKPEEPNIPDIPEIPEFPDRPMPPIPERPERDYDDYFKFPIYVEEKPVIEEKIVPQREYLIHNAYMSGYPDGTFMPNGNMTRAEAAAILTRLLNLPVADINAPNFTDTPSGWYNAYINAIVKAGYMSGYPDGSFKPNAKITRAEFAQLIKNIGNENTTVAPFEDIKGHWAEDAINKAFGNGYITGYPDGTFKPDGNITRAEATVICNKMFDRKVDIIGQLTDLSNVGSIKLFKDVDSSHWAYFEIMEATNDHRFYRRTIGLVEENWTEIR